MLAIDRPFKRGDFISAGGVEGTVEQVSIRSTRVRTSDDSLIIVPNGKLSDLFVNNLGSRRFHLGSLKLPLPITTSAAQLEALIKGAREIADAIPQVSPERTSLALTTAGADGLQLALTYSLDVSRGGNETAIVNALVLDILKLHERLKVQTADKPPLATSQNNGAHAVPAYNGLQNSRSQHFVTIIIVNNLKTQHLEARYC